MDEKKAKNKKEVADDGNIGRLNDKNPEKTSSDISNIDQQEGTLQHGRIGGNFDKNDKKEEK